ncbi:MAG: hypothetical protein ACRCUJ_08680 [Phocaeicola sp.]
MKLIYKIILALLPMSIMLASCSNDNPFSVAGPDDEPHILAPTFPDRNNGELPTVATIDRDGNFSMELVVTPADHVEVVWYLDGKECATGKKIDVSLLAGVYEMKVVVTTTQGKSTSREGIVRVNPLQEDPWGAELGFERIIAPGNWALLYGGNLTTVESMRIGEELVTEMEVVTEGDQTYLSYLVPVGISEGQQRVVLIDAEGVEYGADKVTISSSALITSGADRITANTAWSMTGINLDKVVSLKIGDLLLETFSDKTATSIQLMAPSLEDGSYMLTGLMQDGKQVTFFANKTIYTEAEVVVSSSQVLWSGHHYVSWDLPDDSPNKTFNLIKKEEFAAITAGAVMSIHYSIEWAAEYHQIRTTSGHWADLPGTAAQDVSADGVIEIVLTQQILDMIQSQEGFLCVGHGYFVDLITLK